jgi:hypothetical protein
MLSLLDSGFSQIELACGGDNCAPERCVNLNLSNPSEGLRNRRDLRRRVDEPVAHKHRYRRTYPIFRGQLDIAAEPTLHKFLARPAAGQRTGQITAKTFECHNGQLCLWRPSASEQRQHCPGSDPVFQARTERVVIPMLSRRNHDDPRGRSCHVCCNGGCIPKTCSEGWNMIHAETEGASVWGRQNQSGTGRDRSNRSRRKRKRNLGTATGSNVRMFFLCKPSRGIIFPPIGQSERPTCNHDIDRGRERQNIYNDHGIADR